MDWLDTVRDTLASIYWMNVVRRLRRSIFAAIALLAALATLLFIPEVRRVWDPPPPSKILIVGFKTGDYSQAWDDFMEGVYAAPIPEIEGNPATYDLQNDEGDSLIALKHVQAALNSRDVLAIILPTTSSIAESIVREFRSKEGNKMPLIIPLATNPNLLNQEGAPRNGKRSNIFRMVPNDSAQVEELKKQIIQSTDNSKVYKVGILRETGNKRYGRYLADQMWKRLEQCDGCSAEVVVNTVIDGREALPDGILELERIFYVGDQAGAVLAHRQAKPVLDQQFFLTDASLANSRIKWAAQVPKDDPINWAAHLPSGSVMTFSHGCAGDLSLPEEISERCNPEAEPNFVALGYDAVNMISGAVTEIERTETVSRATLVSFLQNKKPIKGVASNYNFDSSGENIPAEFHVYHVNNKKWEHCGCKAKKHNWPDMESRTSTTPGQSGNNRPCKEQAET